jgi:hypothetical protein
LLAVPGFRCYNAVQRMADWKQITARIRRARTSKDPVAQLSNLYEKTQDAMVAFELARHFETAGSPADAGKWYAAAAARFRRSDWKTKAMESAARLGFEVPVGPNEIPNAERPSVFIAEVTNREQEDDASAPVPLTAPEPGIPFMQNAEMFESMVAMSSEVQSATALAPPTPDAKRRRRGRRGGRNRRKSTAPASGAATTPAVAAEPVRSAPARREHSRPPTRPSHAPARRHEVVAPDEGLPPLATRRSVPPLPVDAPADFTGPSVKGRYGDPGLSSRLSLLEMQFRRLLTCEPAKLDETVSAPVGPGVFVLTDSDLTSYYYVEACQTLRVAIGNLLRGGASRRGAESIKPQLADHLGIPETRVAKYLADHCVVRWLQLDEGASHFAHFVIAVLRPVLNE